MRRARYAVLLATLAGGCTTGPIPVRDLAHDPAVGSAEAPYQFGPQRNNFNSPGARGGVVMPPAGGGQQMPQSGNSMPAGAAP